MGLIKDLKIKDVDALANIDDAAFPGDLNGTPADDAYFKANVHPYLKEIGLLINTENVFYVSPSYTDLSDPAFGTLAAAHTASTGSSTSNRRAIIIKPGVYNEALALNLNGYIIFVGVNRMACRITDDMVISQGIYLFNNAEIAANISIEGGIAVFENCSQYSGVTALSGGATLLLSNTPYWGNITVEDDNNKIYLENVKDMLKDGSNKSIIIDSAITDIELVIDDVRMQGIFSNESSVSTDDMEISGLKEERIARPRY